MKPSSRTRSRRPGEAGEGAAAGETQIFTLLVIDNAPFQREAWAEFHSAQKRLEKAARDLHRHEEVDQPAYDRWLHQTFPTLISQVRQMHEEVFNKGQQVQAVQMMASLTGRSHKRLWREFLEADGNPEEFMRQGANDFFGGPEEPGDDFDSAEEDDAEKLLEDETGGSRRSRAEAEPDFEGRRGSAPGPKHALRAAKEVYRRLVQRLHPDRGGEWTEARKRLWHEVQAAWANGDVDWLVRLEVEWESANEVLGPASPIGRLRQAIAEFEAARRDTERKLRGYRRSPPWRFTLSEKKRETLRRKTEDDLRNDLEYLQQQLAYFNTTIAAWEKPVGLAAARDLRNQRSPSGTTPRRGR
jgi:hypothetical protein